MQSTTLQNVSVSVAFAVMHVYVHLDACICILVDSCCLKYSKFPVFVPCTVGI